LASYTRKMPLKKEISGFWPPWVGLGHAPEDKSRLPTGGWTWPELVAVAI
jgi:hypothetical protein